MAKLPVQKRLRREDLPDAPGWMDVVIDVINSFLESLYFALNKQITFTDNIACQIKQLSFLTNSTYSGGILAGFTKIQFNHNLKTKPIGVEILQILPNSGTPIIKPVCLSWSQENGNVYINYITGLENSTTYNLVILVK